MPHPVPRVAVDLSPRALVKAGVRGALALDVGAVEGRAWSLVAHPSALADVDAPPRGYDERHGSVAVVQVRGPIDQRAQGWICGMTDGYDSIEARFKAALSDVDSRAVVLDIDSPGGDAHGMTSAVRRMRAAADRAGKPVFAVADEWATSAAYALLLVADKGRVHVPPQGRTASIGTVLMVANEGPALAKEGVEVSVFRSGDRKMRPSGVEAIDDATAKELQARVDSLAADFAAWVAERRGLNTDDVLAIEGASLSGVDAARRGLIDGNMSAHGVIEMAQEEAALKEKAARDAATLATVRVAMGLSAEASEDVVVARAREGREALSALAEYKDKAARAEAARIALEESTAREKAAAEAVQKRAAFASEVKTACDAGLLTPPTEAKLLAHYDAHGEASARSTFELARADKPLVQTTKVGAIPTSADAVPKLTKDQEEHAKALGVTPNEYAVSVLGTGKAG